MQIEKAKPEGKVREGLEKIVGQNHVLTEASDVQSYTTDWTKSYQGDALAVVQPSNAQEVSQVVQYCSAQDISIVPQGGNTGICGGGVPLAGHRSIVLSLRRMNRIRAIDVKARTATVDAGVILETLQAQVAEAGLIFPLMFGARGSCSIGGNLSTNAGGSNVVRYGNTRDLCIGIEAVMADGSIINALTGLHKDNTGYDLKNLLIGAEGTLGIVTGAVLKLSAEPVARATAFLSLASLDAALSVLNLLQDQTGNLVEAFEFLPAPIVNIICEEFSNVRRPLEKSAEVGVLVEIASTQSDDAEVGDDGSTSLTNALMAVLEKAMEDGAVLDAMLATSEQQRIDLWTMRESVLEAILAQGNSYHMDISLPLSRVAEFVSTMDERAARDGFRPLTIGHLGDGNLHYALAAVDDASWDKLPLESTTAFAFALLKELNGSFSAEHGIGQSKKALLKNLKEPSQRSAMKAIKAALDPKNIMNPGKVFTLPLA